MREDGRENPQTAGFIIGAHLAAIIATMLVAGVNLLKAQSEHCSVFQILLIGCKTALEAA